MICYLDHAATSWPKPPEVAQAMLAALSIAGSVGRGAHAGATEAAQVPSRLRVLAAARFRASSASYVVLTSGGTESLNLAFASWLRSGDHVVTTAAEHNSVLRPLELRRRNGAGDVTVVPVDRAGRVDAAELLAAIRPETRLVAMTHVSNVTGAIQPIELIGAALRASSVAFLIDAAQSAGELPIDMKKLGIDLLATSGHKGLLGPAGSGLLLVSDKVAEDLQPWKCGGTGSHSESLQMPHELPHRLEAGTPALPAFAGLAAAMEQSESRPPSLAARIELTRRLWAGLERIEGISRVGPTDPEQHHGPTSIVIAGWDPHDAAAVLDATFDIRVRAGRHCAASIHDHLGTATSGGTLRIAPGHTTTAEEIDRCVQALAELTSF